MGERFSTISIGIRVLYDRAFFCKSDGNLILVNDQYIQLGVRGTL